jgi:hypothetical protein
MLKSESKLKIYFAGAISAGRERQPVYAQMVRFLESLDAEVLSAHVARPEVLAEEAKLAAEEIFQRDMKFIENCAGVVAEVSRPSLGVGYEIATAQHGGRSFAFASREFLSRLLTGNPHPQLRVASIAMPPNGEEALRLLPRFAKKAGAAALCLKASRTGHFCTRNQRHFK